MTTRLVCWQGGSEQYFDHETLQEAAANAIGQINGRVSYPYRIEVDGMVVWEAPGPGYVRESLEKLLGAGEGER